MTLRLYDKDLDKLILKKGFAHSFCPPLDTVAERSTAIDKPFGNGFYKEIFFDGVHIGFGNVFLPKKLLFAFDNDFETVEMHFSLNGVGRAISEQVPGGISFDKHQHNIIYANALSGRMEWEGDNFHFCEVNLTPSFFKKFLPEDSQLFDRFREYIEKGKSGLLSVQNSFISHAMYAIIEDIMSCQRKGVFKRMFLESKVLELLLLQFEQFMADAASPQTSLKKTDVDKIYAVRDYLLAHLDADCSLIDLAHRVGTNEFTLKKGFKELFGRTVFAFWSDCKMTQAKHYLLEQKMSVAEVAALIGYKNQRHFSAAFKKRFGIVPSQFKHATDSLLFP